MGQSILYSMKKQLVVADCSVKVLCLLFCQWQEQRAYVKDEISDFTGMMGW